MDLEHEPARHRLLARREKEHGPLTPWFPDNSRHEQPHDPRSHVIPGPEARELAAGFATDVAPLLFAMLDRVRAGSDDKELIALELMLVTSATARRSPRFLRYRFLLNCTYLHISLLGLTPFQRLRTCHAAANAVEEIHGVSAVDRIRAYVEAHSNQ